jgi:hypothetical protein
MINKVERGRRKLDAFELSRVARALSVPMGLLIEPRPAVLSRRSVLLSEDDDTVVSRESERMDVALAAWLYDIRQLVELGVLEPRPSVTYPGTVSSTGHARQAAAWLRARLDLGTGPISTMMEVCEEVGQFLLLTDVPGDGASVVDEDVAAAVVSLTGQPGRRRATAAHELAHLVLGDEYSSDLGVSASRAEREAAMDAFAAELLLPAEALAKAREDGPLDRQRLVRFAAEYRTSWSLTLRQAERATLINTAERRKLNQSTPTRVEFQEALGWAPQPDLEGVRVPPRYADAAMQAWRQDLITTARLVDLMHGQVSATDLPPREDPDVVP